MDYISNYHWIWYGLGFVFCPRLTIMIMLSIHFNQFIPLPLMIIGWCYVILTTIVISSQKEGE